MTETTMLTLSEAKAYRQFCKQLDRGYAPADAAKIALRIAPAANPNFTAWLLTSGLELRTVSV